MNRDDDREVVRWFHCALVDPRPAVRIQAIKLLGEVLVPGRSTWLSGALHDVDRRVAVAARCVLESEIDEHAENEMALFESDFGQGPGSHDLEWQWEYVVKVCRAAYVPTAGRLVWTAEEDDRTARLLAMMKSFPGGEPPEDAVGVVVSKRFVTKYTRSPRSLSEACSWRARGRPRYVDP